MLLHEQGQLVQLLQACRHSLHTPESHAIPSQLTDNCQHLLLHGHIKHLQKLVSPYLVVALLNGVTQAGQFLLVCTYCVVTAVTTASSRWTAPLTLDWAVA